MRTVVVTGGTHGIGKALVEQQLQQGAQVLAVGSTQAGVKSLAPHERLTALAVDLATAAGVNSLAETVHERFDHLDALVLGAFRYEPTRRETVDGLERTFALYVYSRFRLAEKLRPLLEQGTHASVIVSLCGTGTRGGTLRWDDLQGKNRYRPTAAILQGARATDLLGTAFTTEHPHTTVRYVLYNPGFVDTGMARQFRGSKRVLVQAASILLATSVEQAIEPIGNLLDAPPPEPLSAWRVRRPLPVSGPAFDTRLARRLTTLLRSLPNS